MQDLKDVTQEVHYENYRAERLSRTEQGAPSPKRSIENMWASNSVLSFYLSPRPFCYFSEDVECQRNLVQEAHEFSRFCPRHYQLTEIKLRPRVRLRPLGLRSVAKQAWRPSWIANRSVYGGITLRSLVVSCHNNRRSTFRYFPSVCVYLWLAYSIVAIFEFFKSLFPGESNFCFGN